MRKPDENKEMLKGMLIQLGTILAHFYAELFLLEEHFKHSQGRELVAAGVQIRRIQEEIIPRIHRQRKMRELQLAELESGRQWEVRYYTNGAWRRLNNGGTGFLLEENARLVEEALKAKGIQSERRPIQ